MDVTLVKKIFSPLFQKLKWCDEKDDTALQTQDSKFKPWRSEAEHATSRPRTLPTTLSFTSGRRRNIFVSFKPPRPGNENRKGKVVMLTTTLGHRSHGTESVTKTKKKNLQPIFSDSA